MRPNQLVSLCSVILGCLIAMPASAQQGTVFILRLNDELVSSFKSYGYLKSNVPAENKSNISFVELKYGDSQTEAVNMDIGFQVNGENAELVLDDNLLNQIASQPIRIPVPSESSNFSQIVLVYSTPKLEPMPQMNDGGVPMDMYYIRLGNTKTMSGAIDGFNQFEIETRFGKVSMPMDQVAGIRFHADANDSCVVVLTNGDVITGVPVIEAVKLKTDWGQADIEPKYIESLTTTPGARFSQESTDFGLRWNLKTGTSVAPSTPRFGN